VQIKQALGTVSLCSSRLARGWLADMCSGGAITPQYVAIGVQSPPHLRHPLGTTDTERVALVLCVQKDSAAARRGTLLLRIFAFRQRLIATKQRFMCLGASALPIAHGGRRCRLRAS
jgi:hypothetical protein